MMHRAVRFDQQDIGREQLVAELFYEQEHPLISGAYKHGFMRTVYSLARALLPRIGLAAPALPAFVPGETVAIAFFENEYQAVLRNQQAAGISRVIRLDLQNLPIIRQTLGWRGTVRELAYFVGTAIRRRGLGALRTLGMPALGWLLYKALCQHWSGVQRLRVATMNMQHPVSVGVVHAALASGHRTLYVEHASTTLAVFKDRGYEQLVVELPHTRALLESAGVARSRILLLREGPDLVATPIQRPVRSVGLCVNDLDSMDAVHRMIQTLCKLGIRVTLRVHDSDRRIDVLRGLAKKFDLLFSSARESRIEAFLGTVDLLIAGNSNVLADALRAGKPAIHYWDGAEDAFDYYGLVAHYRLAFGRNAAQLAELIAPSVASSVSTS